jgi:hypothetical protein
MPTIRCEPCGKPMTPVRNLTVKFAALLDDGTDPGKGEVRPDAYVCTNCGRVEFRVREPGRFSQ